MSTRPNRDERQEPHHRRDLPTSLKPSLVVVGEAGDLSASRDPPQAPSVSGPGFFLFELWPELASAAAEGVASLQGRETGQAVKAPSLPARRGSRKRPDPPLSNRRRPLTRISLPHRLCSERVTDVPLPKAHPTPPNQDGGTLRTVLDARAYMLRLSKDRERSARWQRATQLLLAKADVGAVSRQLETRVAL
jgi:hypothetical protein